MAKIALDFQSDDLVIKGTIAYRRERLFGIIWTPLLKSVYRIW